MAAIERFFKQAKKHLNSKGKIFLEFDSKQKKDIKRLLEGEGFEFVFKKDQFKKHRWLEAKLV
jgi:methylase of polypeptide subunit release factors